MVVPSTVHAAFLKAAKYFRVEAVIVPVGADFRADAAAMIAAIDEDPARTVLVVVSAPSYAHGVIDPVPPVAAAAAERGIRCHVDACIGGWVLPFARRIGRDVAPWTFVVDGVTSISADLHKYGYAPKGTSVLLHRSPELRRPQYFAYADWPGYTMINTTLQSTKSGGPLAGAWAVVQTLGLDGYDRLAREVFEATDRIVEAIGKTPALSVVAAPDSTLVAFATDGTCDAFTLADEMTARGWHIQPQMSYDDQPATIHLSVSAGTLANIEEFVAALTDSVAAAVAAGPIVVDPEIAAFIGALDPTALSDEDFDGLLLAAGLAGGDGIAVPERMAQVNAMIDLASPAMREALLTAFMDRLQRPNR
jgi:glutamate/tyrosine decarboxylase-like PLP-dependent enzyme